MVLIEAPHFDRDTAADQEIRRNIAVWLVVDRTYCKGFLEAINGLFQAAKRRARGFVRLSTIKTVIFLIAGKLDFHAINPHAPQPT